MADFGYAHPPILADPADRETWLAARKKHVTGSVAAAIFGHHPWMTAERLQQEKLALREPDEENAAMVRGRLFEPLAIDWYIRETGNTVEETGLVVHSTHPLIATTGDGWIPDLGEPLEAKVPLWRECSAIRRRGLRDYIVIQTQLEAACYGSERVQVIVLDTENPFESMIFAPEADAQFVADMIGEIEAWWHRHIVNREPVEAAAPLEEIPSFEGEVLQIDDELFDLYVGEYLSARDIAKEADELKTQARDQIVSHLLEHYGLGVFEGSVGRAHYVERQGQRRHAQTVKRIARIGAFDPGLLEIALQMEFPYADVVGALSRVQEFARLDVAALEERGSDYKQLDVYRVRPGD